MQENHGLTRSPLYEPKQNYQELMSSQSIVQSSDTVQYQIMHQGVITIERAIKQWSSPGYVLKFCSTVFPNFSSKLGLGFRKEVEYARVDEEDPWKYTFTLLHRAQLPYTPEYTSPFLCRAESYCEVSSDLRQQKKSMRDLFSIPSLKPFSPLFTWRMVCAVWILFSGKLFFAFPKQVRAKLSNFNFSEVLPHKIFTPQPPLICRDLSSDMGCNILLQKHVSKHYAGQSNWKMVSIQWKTCSIPPFQHDDLEVELKGHPS